NHLLMLRYGRRPARTPPGTVKMLSPSRHHPLLRYVGRRQAPAPPSTVHRPAPASSSTIQLLSPGRHHFLIARAQWSSASASAAPSSASTSAAQPRSAAPPAARSQASGERDRSLSPESQVQVIGHLNFQMAYPPIGGSRVEQATLGVN